MIALLQVVDFIYWIHCADTSEPSNESQYSSIPKLRHSLLKRFVDLPFDDGEGRKKVALTSIGG